MATFTQWPRLFSKIACYLVFLTGLMVLSGWMLGLAPLQNISASWPKMVPATALAFILCGVSLYLAGVDPVEKAASSRAWRVSRACAAVVALLGLFRMCSYIIGWDPHIDYLGFQNLAASPGNPTGNMSPMTALNFFLLGSALFLVSHTRTFWLFQTLTVFGGMVGWLGFSRYCYGGQPLFTLAGMSAPTAFSFLVLSAGILCSRQDKGLVALFISDSAGGTTIRRLLPPALMIPFFFGWLRLNVQNKGWLGPEAALTVFSMANMAILGGMVCATAALVHSIDIRRRETEKKLQNQLNRLALLQRITRAIGERQDLKSIFHVVIRNLEDNLPLDFCCITLYDPLAKDLTISANGARGKEIAGQMAMTEQSRIPIDQNGLSRCVQGELVYEPDVVDVQFPFPQRLARGGLRSMVVAPLLFESQVFGVVVAARKEAKAFVSGECEFLKQLSEHVALAAHQAQLYDALKKAFDDLRQSQQAVMQQERLRALGQMASGIAHDINNAISPVSLYTESLLEKEPNLSDRARSYLTTIQRSIEDVAATVARMKEFYRQREPQLTLMPVQIDQLLQQVADLTKARWSDMPQQKGVVIALRMDVKPGLPPIMGIASEIREALTNLIFNAVDAMPEGGTLTLHAKAVENAAAQNNNGKHATQLMHVDVTDTGMGMDEDTRRHCLEPFFTTKGERGTGLGLAMVYGVAQRHTAEVEIISAPGKGTTFRLVFPIPVTVPVDAQAGKPKTWVVPPRLRILTVDDDPVVIESLRHTLEGDGHLITSADDGREGIKAFTAALKRDQPFDVVITDLGMPYVDGRKVASSVKELSPTTPVILLTGWGQRLVIEGDVPPEVDQVLNKPPKLSELRQALAACFQEPANP